MQSDILDMDAGETAQAIKDGKISSERVVSRYIEHIKAFNHDLNAMVEDRFEEARADAAQADKDDVKKGALFGVPISVKEAYDVKGMKTTGGLPRLKDLIAKQDAAAVAKLKHSGAIVLGKTNTPALCFYQETVNQLYGQTNNPWDLSRTAGGSSGGEGALLAAGGAAVGIGSDIGGSLRFPCHFNGVAGFKPGQDSVSAEGHFPPNTIPLQKRMLGLGPMGKSVGDMELMYDIIANEPFARQSLEDFDISMLPKEQPYPLSDEMQRIMEQLRQYLTNDFSVEQAEPPYFRDSALLWQEMMSIDGGASVKAIAAPGARASMPMQYMKEKLSGTSATHPYLTWALTGAGLFKPSTKRKKTIMKMIADGDRQLQAHLRHRILIFPVYNQGALQHGEVYKQIFSIRKTFLDYMPYVAYANVWGLPALIVPIGKDENDMPVSVQLMSSTGNENALFQLGGVLEKRFGGYNRNADWDIVSQ